MAIVRKETPHAAGLPELSGDPSPVTARGVFRSIHAAASIAGAAPTLRAAGWRCRAAATSGYHLARELIAGRCVVDRRRCECPGRPSALSAKWTQRWPIPDTSIQSPAEIYAPCALGGILNSGTIPELHARSSPARRTTNCWKPADADRIEARGILYVPDFIANAGGVINGTRELLGWDRERAWAKVEAIYDTTLEIFRLAIVAGNHDRGGRRSGRARAAAGGVMMVTPAFPRCPSTRSRLACARIRAPSRAPGGSGYSWSATVSPISTTCPAWSAGTRRFGRARLGGSLGDHRRRRRWMITSQDGTAARLLADEHWDFVVLQQGPSTLPESRATCGRARPHFRPLMEQAGGRVALYEVWPDSTWSADRFVVGL